MKTSMFPAVVAAKRAARAQLGYYMDMKSGQATPAIKAPAKLAKKAALKKRAKVSV